MLGVCLLFVGIVLISNGACTLYRVDPKSSAVINIFVGGLSVIINIISLIRGDYYAAGTGLLFGFTYLYIAINKIYGLDPIPFAIFSTFVSVNAFIIGFIEGISGSFVLGISPDWRWAAIWWLWGILWGTEYVTVLMRKNLGKFVPRLQIFEGLITGWIPGMLLLLRLW